MSVCDEGKWCPSAIVSGDANEYYHGCFCFGLHKYDALRREIVPPDSCPHAAALKAVVEDESLVLVAMKRQPKADAIFTDEVPYRLVTIDEHTDAIKEAQFIFSTPDKEVK